MMDVSVGEKYHSNSQKIRVITENWFNSNMYCPCCGSPKINHFENNKPARLAVSAKGVLFSMMSFTKKCFGTIIKSCTFILLLL